MKRIHAPVSLRAPSDNRRGTLRTLLIRSVGLVLLCLLLLRVPVASVAGALAEADLGLVALGILLLVPFFILKTWRWQILLRAFGIPVSFLRVLSLYFVGLFAGYATPGQLGEAVKALYLKRDGYGMTPIMATIVLDRLGDLAVLVTLATLGVPLLGLHVGGAEIGLALVVIGVLAALLMLALPLARARLERLLASVTARMGHVAWKAAARELHAGWPALLALTLLAYSVHYARYYVLLRAVHADMPIAAFVGSLSIVSLAALLPISPMGVGTRDLALVALFGLYGISAPAALAFSTLVLASYLANLLLGFLAWLREGSRPAT